MDGEELKIIKEQLENRSEEVQEIMGFIPNWLIRWGITVIFTTILVLLIGSWFFKYPEILTSSITVTTKNPPASIIAKSSGKFEKFFIKDGDKVKRGDLLAVIENPCNYKNYLDLKEILKSINRYTQIQKDKTKMILPNNESIKKKRTFKHINLKDQFNFSDLKNIKIKKSLKLGELQAHYELFIKAYQDYLYFMNNKLVKDELDSLKTQLDKNKLLLKQSKEQKNIQKKELELFKQKYSRAKGLMNEGIISKEEFESSKGIYLQKEYAFKGSETNITNLELRIEELKRNIINIKNKFEQDRENFSTNFIKVYKTLIGEISLWEQRYIMKSPINGIIIFTKYWNINQNVKNGAKVFTIIPEFKEELIGRVRLPISGSGKVRPGQDVNVKFDNYPFMEYGMVRGNIINKSRISSEDKYILEVEFPIGLITNYKKKLKFNQEMKGIAEIITEDISLLERLFSKLKTILKN